MQKVKKFNTYNFVTGAVDGTLAYDFSNPGLYQEEEAYELPQKRRPGRKGKTQAREWIKEDTRSKAEVRAEARTGQGLSPLSVVGVLAVMMLLTMVLLAQIRLTSISDSAAQLEQQIAALELEKDKLTVEYETIFNLKDVEEYATEFLGMQEPDSEQIFYLTGVAAADKAVIVTQQQTDMFSLGLEDMLSSVRAYIKAYSG